MTRPEMTEIENGAEGWDAPLNDNFRVLGLDGDPMAVPEFPNTVSLPAANQFDRCLAAVEDATGWTLYLSNGTSWVPLARRGAAVSDSVAASTAAIVADFNALLAVLRASGVLQT